MADTIKQMAPILGLNVQGDLGPMTLYTNKRGKRVVFDKAPPLTPATPAQKTMRDRFRQIALSWQQLTPAQRRNWQLACDAGSLQLTGFNLYTWWQCRHDLNTIATISRQTGVPIP